MSRPAFSDAFLDSLRTRGDPTADEVVADFVAVRGVTDPEYLVRELIQHRRLPLGEQVPSVRAYFEDANARPSWSDPQTLRRGQRVFERYGIHIASALYCASLPMSYTSVRGTEVLARTMALVSDTRRRLARTGEMLLDVMGVNDAASREPFAPDTAAYRAPRGVRLFHATVRHLLDRDPSFDREALGVPINQEDLLGTLASFTVVVIDSLRTFGVPLSGAERDAYAHVWLTVGALLGVDPELLRTRRSGDDAPLHWDELVELTRAIERRHSGSSAAGRRLMHALLEEESEALPVALRGLPRACTRALIGPVHSAHLAIPPAGWTALLLRPLPLVNRALFSRVYYDLSGWLFAKLTRALYRTWIARAGAGADNPWRFVEQPWKLEPAPTRVRRIVRHPVRLGVRRCATGTPFAVEPTV